jgi:hypothetical protein
MFLRQTRRRQDGKTHRLERRRGPARRRRPRGSAPRFVSGRDQPVPGRGLAQVHRSIRRRRRTSADTGVVSRGSRQRGHSQQFGHAAAPVRHAAVPAAAIGVRAGWPGSCGESYNWTGSGPIACRRTAGVRGGIRSCRVLVSYRLIAPGSEWKLHCDWFGRSAMADLLGSDFRLAEPHKLYACHDLC